MDTINIVAAADDNYAQHLSVMLTSVVENNSKSRFAIFLLSTFSQQNIERIKTGLARYDCKIHEVEITDEAFKSLPIGHYVTKSTYFRLAMGDLLPRDLDKALYLDCDLVVAGSLSELWNIELDGKILAAVQDEGFTDHQKLGMPEGVAYFNAGVMLVDLKRWRDERVGARAIEFATSEPSRITWWDQCALNATIPGRWLPLDRKWNLQTEAFASYGVHGLDYDLKKFKHLGCPVIVHYAGPSKPWHYLNEHPLKRLYWDHLGKTPWQAYRPPDRYPHNVIIKQLRWLCPPLVPVYKTIRRYI